MEQLARARKSFELLKNNKIIFVPNLLMLAFNAIFLIIFLYLTGLIDFLFGATLQPIFTARNLVYLVIYLSVVAAIDNFFTCSKYGMIKDLILKGKTNLKRGFQFGKKYYYTTVKIHAIVFLLLVIPTLAVAIYMFTCAEYVVIRMLFTLFLVIYLILVSVRLLFLYPVMTFEDEGAYQSFKDDIHYVKSHIHHTLMTWIFVVGVGLAFSMVKQMARTGLVQLSNYIIIGAVLGFLLLIFLEITVSIWEHIFIFESYFEGKKGKVSREKAVKKKVTKRKVSKKKTVKRKKK